MEAVKGDEREGSIDSESEEEDEEDGSDEEEEGGELVVDQTPSAEQDTLIENAQQIDEQSKAPGTPGNLELAVDSPPDPLVEDVLSDPGREISRSPPKSRSPSPDSLAKMTASLSLSSSRPGIKDIVSSDLTKSRARLRQKHHSKRGAHRAGRPQGSKAKQDNRVKLDTSGFWE